MRKLWRVVSVCSAVTVGALGTAFLEPAAATHVQCGDVITEDTTLDSNVGPCKQDGLVVAASGVTLDLDGYSVLGANKNAEQAGIRLQNVSGVTVTSSKPGGTVAGFDAGVVVEGGSGNEVSNLTVRDNINDLQGPVCELGDGILVLDSDDNLITANTVVNNGPFSGIALAGDSDDNVVSNNQVHNNNAPNIRDTSGRTGRCGAPFSRPIQAIGIRVEGPGATANVVEGNTVTNSAIAGISIHGYVCNPPDPSVAPDEPNTNNFILNNTVSGTGSTTGALDPVADGIAILRQGPLTVVCSAYGNTIAGNTSFDNFRDGIHLGATTSGNTVDNNVVYNNGRDGIFLAGAPTSGGAPVIDPTTGQPFTGAVNNTLTGNEGLGNTRFDGSDFNPNCDNNDWSANVFVTYNQPCVVAP